MFFTKNRQLIRWIIIIASFAIISLILWNTYVFFQHFKEEERAKMELWAKAQIDLKQNLLENDIHPIINEIILSKNAIPKILVDKDNKISTININENLAEKSDYIKALIIKFESENDPIKMSFINNETGNEILLSTLYYGNSPLLNNLKYYPLALLLIIFLFATVVYLFYKTNKNAVQNKLWTGMAKETAHQIGTPLSSLMGWAEILKTENVNTEYIAEIEKDIHRLQTITERFSKIGSLPTLEKTDIVAETKTSYDYLKTRSSKLIHFEIELPEEPVFVNLNPQLYSWTIENLVKNAIDAMKGKGNLTLKMTQLEDNLKIQVIDTGKGLTKKQYNTIFEPGYTTKKRGWGLGLSLTKRIVEDFHNGKIKVLKSDIGKGTTMQITLKTV